jgi:hypothetical protein
MWPKRNQSWAGQRDSVSIIWNWPLHNRNISLRSEAIHSTLPLLFGWLHFYKLRSNLSSTYTSWKEVVHNLTEHNIYDERNSELESRYVSSRFLEFIGILSWQLIQRNNNLLFLRCMWRTVTRLLISLRGRGTFEKVSKTTNWPPLV